MREHTGGPWQIDGRWITDASGDVIVACLMGAEDPCAPDSPTEREANAHLLVAAPELLAALEEVVAIADRKTDAFDRAHAAIQKARPARPSGGA